MARRYARARFRPSSVQGSLSSSPGVAACAGSRNGIAELREVWQEALNNPGPGVNADDLLTRLERKYQAIADRDGAAE